MSFYLPGGGGFTKKQQHAIQVASSHSKASAQKLRAAFTAQRSGARRGGGNGGGNSRPQRSRARAPAQMPSRISHSQVPRGGAPTRSQRQAWAINPATSDMMAPQGHGYYDAFTTFAGSAMTHLSIGPATPIVSKTTCLMSNGESIKTDYQFGAQMLVIGPSSSKTQAMLYRCSSGRDDDAVDSVAFDSSQLQSDSPSESIPTRCSVRIRNYTNAYSLGGVVRVLRATTGMFLDRDYTSNADFMNLLEGVRDHRRTCSYTGKEFVSALQTNCIVADQSRSLLFADNGVSPSAAVLPWFVNEYANKALPYADHNSNTRLTFDIEKPVDSFTCFVANPTFSPIVIIFEPFGAGATANTYECIVQSQFLAHYRQGTMLANLAITPSSNHAALEKHRNKEEAKGSMLSSVGKFLYNHRSEIAQGISTFAGPGRILGKF